jgi:hypothetical protein
MPPPTSGPYAYYPPYGTFGPDQPGFPTLSQAYVDPVFGSTIRRLTNLYPNTGPSNIYGKNGYWNADGTRFMADASTGPIQVIDTRTGSLIQSIAGSGDSSFDPINPDIMYRFNGSRLEQISISTGTVSTVKTFSASLDSLGGSVDWIDNSGRYMLLNIGGVFRVWDKQADVLYSGSINASFGNGWAGMAPDGSGVVLTGGGSGRWYAINHGTLSVSTSAFTFWSGGDHGDLVSASDGNTYFVGTGCCDNTLYAVNTRTGVARALIPWNSSLGAWCDGTHYSGISRGALRDWALVNTETDSNFCGGVDDVSNPDPISSWWKYRQEILMVNVVTGNIRRLAHHRSRHTEQYCNQPRVSVNWDGTKAMYASNYGVVGIGGPCGYSDLYSVDISGSTDTMAPATPAGLTAN